MKGRNMTASNVGRYILGGNAAFSAMSALVLLLMPGRMSLMLFSDPAGWVPASLTVLAVGLLIFTAGLAILVAGRRMRRREVMIVSALDASWVAMSALFVFVVGSAMTFAGVALVEGIAIVVALFGIGQYLAARKIPVSESRARVSLYGAGLVASVTRKAKAGEDVVWQVMTDHPRYAEVAGNISRVDVLQGAGLGMKRRCFGLKGESWEETCTSYEDGRAFEFHVHTDAPDYPFPFNSLHARWSLEAVRNGTEFTIRIEAAVKGNGFARRLFYFLSKRSFEDILVELADAWAERMESEIARPAANIAAE
jgi:hypothetical protein